MKRKPINNDRLDAAVAAARRDREEREQGYRAKALKMYSWICGRCQREFDRSNLHELTVHHRDHDHSNNPEDGSNWELLCLYCHDNEHQRQLHKAGPEKQQRSAAATHQPFAALNKLLEKDPQRR